jgi:hypothetical protein
MTFLNNVTGFISDPILDGQELVLYSYQTTTSIVLTDYNISGAEFLSINSTGYVSGTPELWSHGNYFISISGMNLGVTYYQNYTLTIQMAETYTITSTPVTTGQEGEAYSYQAICDGTVTLWNISGAEFLSINSTGYVSGTPENGTAGNYTISILASTLGYPAYQNFSLSINASEGGDIPEPPPEDEPMTIDSNIMLLVFTIFFLGMTTLVGLRYWFIMIISGFAYLITSVFYLQPLDPNLGLLMAGTGLIFMFWGGYRYVS